jgi:hypothetical protein
MKDPLQAMAQIVKRTGRHGTGYLKKDEAGTWINVGLRRAFPCDQQRCNLQGAEEQKTATQNAGGVTRSLHEAPQGASLLLLVTFEWAQKLHLLLYLSSYRNN